MTFDVLVALAPPYVAKVFVTFARSVDQTIPRLALWRCSHHLIFASVCRDGQAVIGTFRGTAAFANSSRGRQKFAIAWRIGIALHMAASSSSAASSGSNEPGGSPDPNGSAGDVLTKASSVFRIKPKPPGQVTFGLEFGIPLSLLLIVKFLPIRRGNAPYRSTRPTPDLRTQNINKYTPTSFV